jgi:hypothetical protein
VTYFIIGVVRNVLRLVAIENLEGGGVACGWRIDATEFVILLPEIGFDQFGRGQELKNRNSPRVRALFFFPVSFFANALPEPVNNAAPGARKAAPIPMFLRKERLGRRLGAGNELTNCDDSDPALLSLE